MATQIAEPARAQDSDFSIGIVSASDNLGVCERCGRRRRSQECEGGLAADQGQGRVSREAATNTRAVR